MWLLKLIAVLAAAYLAVIALLYAAQTWMLFPAGMTATSGSPLPPSAARLQIETNDGVDLRGVHIAPLHTVSDERLVLLGFGGNAWNAETLATYLHGLFPEADIVTFHYRGYRPSTGAPSAAALLADASVVHDHVITKLETERVIAVGFSIGTGVAAHLASHRPLAGVILVSPFDSLEALVRQHYPWAPVRWLLRHHMSPAEDLRESRTPIALIAAGRDTIVPPERTDAFRQTVSAVVFDRTITDAGHNDLYSQPDFHLVIAEALQMITSTTVD